MIRKRELASSYPLEVGTLQSEDPLDSSWCSAASPELASRIWLGAEIGSDASRANRLPCQSTGTVFTLGENATARSASFGDTHIATVAVS